jgi:hypothetical protein
MNIIAHDILLHIFELISFLDYHINLTLVCQEWRSLRRKDVSIDKIFEYGDVRQFEPGIVCMETFNVLLKYNHINILKLVPGFYYAKLNSLNEDLICSVIHKKDTIDWHEFLDKHRPMYLLHSRITPLLFKDYGRLLSKGISMNVIEACRNNAEKLGDFIDLLHISYNIDTHEDYINMVIKSIFDFKNKSDKGFLASIILTKKLETELFEIFIDNKMDIDILLCFMDSHKAGQLCSNNKIYPIPKCIFNEIYFKPKRFLEFMEEYRDLSYFSGEYLDNILYEVCHKVDICSESVKFVDKLLDSGVKNYMSCADTEYVNAIITRIGLKKLHYTELKKCLESKYLYMSFRSIISDQIKMLENVSTHKLIILLENKDDRPLDSDFLDEAKVLIESGAKVCRVPDEHSIFLEFLNLLDF